MSSQQEEAPSVPTHRFAKFNPFKDADDEGGDEQGQIADQDHIAGGGHQLGGKADAEARKTLRVSHALRSFLASVGEITEDDVGGDNDETNVRPQRMYGELHSATTHAPPPRTALARRAEGLDATPGQASTVYLRPQSSHLGVLHQLL